MNEKRKTLKRVLYVVLLMLAIVILFWWYSGQNRKRIETQSLNYAVDSAQQTANYIERELKNAQSSTNTYAYFLGESLSAEEIDAKALSEMAESALVDFFTFVDKDGMSLFSDGRVLDMSDSELYINGIKGETGMSVEFGTDFTDETVLGFYTPVRSEGEIIGVLQGGYFAEAYLQSLLSTTRFGEEADVFLCMRDGTEIVCSDNNECTGNLFDFMRDSDRICQESLEEVRKVFQDGGEGGFICTSEGRTDNICVINLPQSGYVLVQVFPGNVTRSMIDHANYTGIMLIGLFVIYSVIVLVDAGRERKALERKTREMAYVTDGVNKLFARFVLVDFEKDTYQYLSGTRPERENFPPEGGYSDFADYQCSFVKEEGRQKFRKLLDKEALIAALDEHTIDVRYESHVERDGRAEWEHMNVICLERKDGRACKVLVIRQNITELKEKELRIQAELSLAIRKERQYRIAITSNAISAYDFNLTRDLIQQDIVRVIDGRIISLLDKAGMEAPCRASEWFERCKEYIAEESMADYSAAANLHYLEECFMRGETQVDVEYWSEYGGEDKMCVRQSFIMTWDDDTGDIMVMVVAKEITEQVKRQKEQTQALQDALMQAQHANNAKTTFLSNMSHDIRTPMNAIIGFATIAASHIDNKSQVQDCLQKVLSSSNHLLSLINDILDMSRIESGKVQIKEQECNISEMMHNLVNIIQPQVKAKQLQLFIDTFEIANEDVIADALKMNQVFINLLSNAVKYTPAGGMISFRIMQKTTFRHGYGDYIFIIKDNGIGMTEEFVKHIFEPFERESSATKTGIQGTGLGMAITKNIVDMMNGTIEVYSKRGEGSEFRVELSLKLQDIEKNAQQIQELQGLRALVVDDDFNTCDSVSKMLKQIGMRSEWTTSGREAVYRAKAAYEEGDSYHTYIIDWQMPETSGIETARRIRASVGDEAPIIILTAYDWSDIEDVAKEAGITAFCAKPLFMSDLKSALLIANNLIEKEEGAAGWTEADFDGKRILLVEDNELNREIAQEILEETGFVVETAPDGTDAVAMMKNAEENYYDAVLMDVQMPIMDGYEATRTIRAMHRKDVKDLPIIAMTANAMDEDKEAALKNGMSAHIAKPIDVDVFISILGQFLG